MILNKNGAIKGTLRASPRELEMAAAKAAGASAKELAGRFGVKAATINQACRKVEAAQYDERLRANL